MGPVVRTGENNPAIDNRKFLVHQPWFLLRHLRGDGGDPPQRDFLRVQKLALGIVVGAVEFPIDDDLDGHAALFGMHQSAGQVVIGKGIDGNKQFLLGRFDFSQNMRRALSLGAETSLDDHFGAGCEIAEKKGKKHRSGKERRAPHDPTLARRRPALLRNPRHISRTNFSITMRGWLPLDLSRRSASNTRSMNALSSTSENRSARCKHM